MGGADALAWRSILTLYAHGMADAAGRVGIRPKTRMLRLTMGIGKRVMALAQPAGQHDHGSVRTSRPASVFDRLLPACSGPLGEREPVQAYPPGTDGRRSFRLSSSSSFGNQELRARHFQEVIA